MEVQMQQTTLKMRNNQKSSETVELQYPLSLTGGLDVLNLFEKLCCI